MFALLEGLNNHWLMKLLCDAVTILLLMISNSLRALVALLVVMVYFLPFSAFLGIRYCYRRRRYPERYTQQAAVARTPRPNPLFVRKKKPRLMSQTQVDEKFPVCKYKQAKVEQQNMPLPSASASILNEEDDAQEGILPAETEHNAATTTTQKSVGDNLHEDVHEHVRELPLRESTELQRTITGQSRHSFIKSIASRAFELAPDLEAQVSVSDERPQEQEPDHLEDCGDDICTICFEAMEDDQDVRLLTCGHIFHSECVDPWLTGRRAYCPLCKYDYYVPVPEEDENAAPSVPAVPPPAQTRRRSFLGMFTRRRSRTNASELSQAGSQFTTGTEDSVELSGTAVPAMETIPEAMRPQPEEPQVQSELRPEVPVVHVVHPVAS